MAADNQLQTRVNEICNDLYSRGERVSVRIILSMMPNVSSTSTIHKYYKAWRDELDQSQKSLLDKLGFSPEFTRAFMTEITRHATEAEKRYREIADDARSQADEAIEELQKVEGFLIEQNKLLDTKDQQIESLKKQLADAIKDGQQQLELQKATFESAHNERQVQLNELAAKCQEQEGTIEQLRRDLVKAELKVDSSTELAETLKTQNAALTAENQQLNKNLNNNATLIATLESEANGNRTLIDQLQNSQASAVANAEHWSKEASVLLARLDKTQTSLDDATQKEKQARELLEESRRVQEAQQAAIHRLEGTIDGQKSQITELRDNLKR